MCEYRVAGGPRCRAVVALARAQLFYAPPCAAGPCAAFAPARCSLSTLKNWVKELQTLGPESIVIAVCGNKLDQEDRRVSLRAACRRRRGRAPSPARARAPRPRDPAMPPPAMCALPQEVRREEAEAFAREIDGIFFETSAKTAVNVSKMFESISRKLPALSAPAFDNLADLRGGNVDPRAGGGKAGKEGGGKGGCC